MFLSNTCVCVSASKAIIRWICTPSDLSHVTHLSSHTPMFFLTSYRASHHPHRRAEPGRGKVLGGGDVRC